MYFDKPFRRRLVAILLTCFATTSMFGSLAHAYVGESFAAVGQEHKTVHSSDLHEVEHGHSHDEAASSHGQQHSHEHNPGDHSHDLPAVTALPLNASDAAPSDTYLAFNNRHYGHAAFNIERPPRR